MLEEVGNEREWEKGRWMMKEVWQWKGWWLLEEVIRDEREWYVRRWMGKEDWQWRGRWLLEEVGH